MAKSKINECENIKALNSKYLLDELYIRKVHEKENLKLNTELDNLGKLNEETLRKKVKENEKKQILLINNKISNEEYRMNLMLDQYKDEERKAKDLCEDKNNVAQKIIQTNEDFENQLVKEKELKLNIIELKNEIDELEILTAEYTTKADEAEKENEKLKENNEKYDREIKEYFKKIEEIQQKIELNNILNDIDINELKMLAQNNSLVNSSINTLMSKWDKVNTKLQEIEANVNK